MGRGARRAGTLPVGLIEFTCSPMAVHLPATPQPRLVERLAALPLAVLDTRTARESHVVVPLRTERLRLRLVNAADVPDLQAHWNERDVRRHLFDGSEVTREFASHLVAAAQEAAEQHDGGMWVVTRSDDGRFVGTATLMRLGEDAPLELLLTLDPAAWGHGYATEAGQRVLRYAFDELRAGLVLADVNAPNPRSRRVAERLGMRAERRATRPGMQFFFIDRKTRTPSSGSRFEWHESRPAPLLGPSRPG
jgi:[ribosomal protein S5]-alanine N-acetyltransferase